MTPDRVDRIAGGAAIVAYAAWAMIVIVFVLAKLCD